MKKLHFYTFFAFALLLALPSPAMAKKAGKVPKDPAKAERKALKKLTATYDANANGIIEGDEIAAIKKAFDADKTGPLKSADTNTNGVLEDTEIAALHPKAKGIKAGKVKKKAKKE